MQQHMGGRVKGEVPHVDVVSAEYFYPVNDKEGIWPFMQHMFSQPLRFVQMAGMNFSIPSEAMSDLILTQQYDNWIEPPGMRMECHQHTADKRMKDPRADGKFV